MSFGPRFISMGDDFEVVEPISPRADEFDESNVTREPAGTPGGGQFTSNGGGSEAKGRASPHSDRSWNFSDKELDAKGVTQKTTDKKELFEHARVGHEEQLDALDRGTGLDKDLGARTIRGDKGELLGEKDLQTPGPIVQIGPVKTEERTQGKVDKDYKGHWENVGDVVRASVAVDSAKEIPAIVDKLRAKGIEIVRGKDRIAKPTEAGYRDLLMNVRYPSGHIGELQVHVKSLLAAKNGPGHALYEQTQKIERAADGRKMTPDETRQVESLNAQQRAIYEPAFNAARGDAGDWDESKHPRGPGGQFGSGEGGTEKLAGRLAGPLVNEAISGGFTYRPGTKTPSSGIMVSRAPSEALGHVVEVSKMLDRTPRPSEAEVRKETRDNVKAWLKDKGLSAIQKLGPDHFLGGYAERKDGKPDGDIVALHFDVSQHFDKGDRDKAIGAGRERNQISVWDLDKGEEIPTGGSGR